MTTTTLSHLSVTTRANVYFDGKCISHSLEDAEGRKLSVGVVLPAELKFGTAAAETMECVAGECLYRLAGSDEWLVSTPGHTFSVPANSSFDIRVTQAYHYICRYA
jgi:purine/pyrimidine-nucleoside phosphorylase